MARPSASPDWATNTNFGAGVNPWNGHANKVAPSGGAIAEGFDPGTIVPAEHVNYLLNLIGQWIDYQDTGAGMFGDGSDGAIVLDGTVAAPAWATKSGTKYTLQRDVFLTDLTVTGAGVQLICAGNRIYATGATMTAAGGIITSFVTAQNATGGGAGTKGLASAQNTIANGTAGVDSAAAGNPGLPGLAATLGFGGAGGAGGHSNATAGGAGGAATLFGSGHGSPRAYSPSMLGWTMSLNAGVGADHRAIFGGASGGTGGGNNVNTDGGSSGAGGGVLALASRLIVLANAADLNAAGGDGAAGTGGAGADTGGGGGGGGGVAMVVYRSVTAAAGTLNSATVCPGGLGGAAGGGAGTQAGSAGSAGTLFLVQI